MYLNNSDLYDDEAAFNSYRKQHSERQNNWNSDKRSRYSATLQRTSGGLCGGHVSSQRTGDSLDEDIKSKENERLRGIKNNFSRLVSCYISALVN